MKAKVDKEFLLKNLFWILLGTAALFLFIKYCILLFGGGDIAKVKKEFTDSQSGLSGKTNAKLVNDKTFLPPWQVRQEEYRKKKNDVWGKAWEAQNLVGKEEIPVISWPTFEAAGRQKQLEAAYFGDPIDDITRGQYRDGYRSQMYREKDRPSMKVFLFPRGTPANFRFPVDGDPEKIFRPVPWKNDVTPSAEECWLAQEELSVRREMVLLLKEALDSISVCKPVKTLAQGEPPLPKGVQRFRNRTWELDLLIEGNTISSKSTIRNITPTRRPQALVNEGLGTVFRLRQGNQTTELEPIRGVLLAYGDKSEFGVASKFDSLDLGREFVVEQVFDKVTSPLKRIEGLEIGALAQSHRVVPVPLVSGPASPAPKPKDDSGNSNPGPMGPMGPGPGPGPGPGGPGYPGNMGNTPVPSDDLSPENLLVRKRYVQVNDQVRRIPVAFTVHVEQAYIQDVLAAVANSRLRIQTTQFQWQHVPGGYTPSDTGGPSGMGPGTGAPRPSWGDDEDRRSRPMGPGPGPMGGGIFGPGGPGPMGGGIFGPGGPSGPGEQTPADIDSVQRNLVELNVYGIATLYNRYPPKPPKPETTTP